MLPTTLSIDLSTGQIVVSRTDASVRSPWILRQGDLVELTVEFLEPTGIPSAPFTVVARPDGFTGIKVGGRVARKLNIDTAYLFETSDFVATGSGQTLRYVASLDVGTEQVNAQLSGAIVRELNVLVDVLLTRAAAKPYAAVTQWPCVVRRGIVRGDEVAPDALPSLAAEIAARAVRYDVAQSLTSGQQAQARANIGAGAGGSAVQRNLSSDLTLADGESLVVASYLNPGPDTLTLAGDAELTIL